MPSRLLPRTSGPGTLSAWRRASSRAAVAALLLGVYRVARVRVRVRGKG